MFPRPLSTRLLAVPLVALGIAFAFHPPLHAADGPRVKIANFTFTPQTLVIRAGTTVTFENDDDIPHVVVATDGSFRSRALDTGDTYAFTFTKSGDFPYFCGIHPQMQGKITVSQ